MTETLDAATPLGPESLAPEPLASPPPLSSTAEKRRRAHVACTSCRRRKVRCDSTRPVCSNCSRSDLECVYEASGRVKRHRSDALDEDSSSIGRRLDRIEQMVSQLVDSRRGGDSESLDDSDLRSESDDDQDADPDLFNLGERRAPVAHALGEDDPYIMYSHGFTNLLFLPRSIGWLCKRIGNEELGTQAEKLLSEIWRNKSKLTLEWSRRAMNAEPLDPQVIEYCLEKFKKCRLDGFQALLEIEEIDVIMKLCCPSGDLSKIDMQSPYALLFPTLILIFTRYITDDDDPGAVEKAPFPPEHMEAQNLQAFFSGLNIASNYFLHPSSFLILRLLLMFIYSMFQRAVFPQMRGLISIAICISTNLGLYRDEGSRRLTEKERFKRRMVYLIVQDIDTKVAVYTSQVPLMANTDGLVNSAKILPLIEDSQWNFFVPSVELNWLYLEVYQKLFSPTARKNSVRSMLTQLLKLDEKLLNWMGNLPAEYDETIAFVQRLDDMYAERRKARAAADDKTALDEMPFSEEESELMRNHITLQGKGPFRCRVGTLICYHHIMILIHSIPAFSPSCLTVYRRAPNGVPPRLRASLDVISDSARAILLLAYSVSGLQSCTCLAMLITNAFSALFLIQIVDPQHKSNAENLILIYRNITRFRARMGKHWYPAALPKLALNLWLIFANALTQMNHEVQQRERHAGAAGLKDKHNERDIMKEREQLQDRAARAPAPPPAPIPPQVQQPSPMSAGSQGPSPAMTIPSPHSSAMSPHNGPTPHANKPSPGASGPSSFVNNPSPSAGPSPGKSSPAVAASMSAAKNAPVYSAARGTVLPQPVHVQPAYGYSIPTSLQSNPAVPMPMAQRYTPPSTMTPQPMYAMEPQVPETPYAVPLTPTGPFVESKFGAMDMYEPADTLYNQFNGQPEEGGLDELELLNLLNVDAGPAQNPNNCCVM